MAKMCPICKSDKRINYLARDYDSGLLLCRICGHEEEDSLTRKNKIVTDEEVSKIIQDKLESVDSFKINSVTHKRNTHRFVKYVRTHLVGSCIARDEGRGKGWTITLTDETKTEKRKRCYELTMEKIEELNTVKMGEHNIFRLMNPYDGSEKDFWDRTKGKTKSRKESTKVYQALRQLEDELSISDFFYLRGDQFASGPIENKYGIIGVRDKYIDWVKSVITSIPVTDGSLGNSYWIEPFKPPSGSYLDIRVKMEAERRTRKVEREHGT